MPDVHPDGRALLGADPIATGKIEDLIIELKKMYTIVIVTHNMQQAARVTEDRLLHGGAERGRGPSHRPRREFDDTEKIFTNPSDSRTEAYVTGKVG